MFKRYETKKKSNSNSLLVLVEGLHQEPCHLKCYKKKLEAGKKAH